MSEKDKRDAGIVRAQSNPENNYNLIKDAARNWLVKKVSSGESVVAGQVFEAVIARFPDLMPSEKRVMGAVMRSLGKEKLIVPIGVSNRMRAHRGIAREWKRTH